MARIRRAWGGFEVHDVIRETRGRNAADWEIHRHAGNQRPSSRPSGEVIDSRIDGFQKLSAKPWMFAVVPTTGCVELRLGFWLDSERPVHRFARLRAIRPRTSSHGSPFDSPLSARRARRSISRAQAACTAASSAGAGSSRLASSSAATSARSSRGSAKASRKRSWDRAVMTPFYHRKSQEFTCGRRDERSGLACKRGK